MGTLAGPLVFPLGGIDPVPGTPLGSWWGGWFPRGFGLSWWGYPELAWFPDGFAADTVPGTNPPGAATFVLLQNGTRVTYSWRTGIHKSYSGRERRSGLIDDPMVRFEGDALLSMVETRATRSRLARYAAQGQPFLLGLSYEALALRTASPGSVVAVHSTTSSDWCVVGARVAVVHTTRGTMEGVIQSYTADEITLDVTLGAIGAIGATIVPLFAIFLDQTQGFGRYPVDLERWSLRARNAVAGLASSPIKAELSLEDPQTRSGALDFMRLVAQTSGAAGNSIVVTQSDDALSSGGELDEDVGAQTLHIKYSGDDTTVDQYVALLAGSSLVRLLGTYTGTDILAAADDEFAATSLSGGVDATPIAVGIGASVTYFNGRPVWDRGVDVVGMAGDSLQSMAETQDFGGLPFAAGMAAVPDWGRDIKISRPVRGEWQWFKLFLDKIKGRWKSFWLPTHRDDLPWISSGVGAITVDAAADVFAWYPNQKHIQIVQIDGTATYAIVTNAVDNGDDTVTLTLIDEAASPVTLSGAAVDHVSWLEVCRLESDTVSVAFGAAMFSAQMTARVVQQDEEP